MDALETHGDESIICVTRDRTDLDPGLTVGAMIIARPASTVPDGELALVNFGGEQVLRRAPVTDGEVIAHLTYRVEVAPDGS